MTQQLTITVGELLFEFSSHARWVAKAQSWFRHSGVPYCKTICVDAKGRICPTGKEFMRADAEGAFPIKVYSVVIEEA